MEHSTLAAFENLCAQDQPPACQGACPTQLEAGRLADLAAAGQFAEARKILERHLPAPALSARLCEGPCRVKCLRAGLDEPVDLPLLERFIADHSRPGRVFPLPKTGHRAALLGSGLSSLGLAHELAKKGHQAEIVHATPLGGWLAELGPADGPASRPFAGPAASPASTEALSRALAETLDQLRSLKVAFRSVEAFSPQLLAQLEEEFEGVFLGLDDPSVTAAVLGLPELDSDPITMGALRPRLFAARLDPATPFASAMSSAKKAAGSLDRLFQGVNPATAREREALTDSRLPVDLSDREIRPLRPPADPARPQAAEVQAEADRCLRCACLRCLPPCPLLRSRRGHPKKYAREFYNNIITAFGIRHANLAINSCAQCGLCGQICPNGFDLGQFAALARLDMTAASHMPVSAHEFALEDLTSANSPAVAFARPQPGGSEKCRRLLFAGCQLPAAAPEAVEGLYAHLCRHLDGGVGLMFACCGAPAGWAGRPGLTGRTVEALRRAWAALGSPEIVATCPSCLSFFRQEMPEATSVSLWTVLEALPTPAGAQALDAPMILHDPCSARLDEPSQNAVRSLLARLGQSFREPRFARRLTLCCGYGGLADQANPALGREYALQRLADGPEPLLVWCVMCRDRFRRTGRASLHALDLLWPRKPPSEALADPPQGLSARREARLTFRRRMLAELWGETPDQTPQEPEMTVKLDIPGSVLEDLESRRILTSDVLAVLENAALNGPTFVNPETGRRLACLRPRQVTFWVEYEVRPDGACLVHRAWSHRMTVPGVQGRGEESPASLEGFARQGGRV
ncbi:MAG: 4Fe-4S dicluster domain-containing protein [Deltaproteobacteria bacterium]|jgi:Fe-S oxidoreductase|nr:4Fe-4S dicluster domain-containing protein [Deltaproteobacteria bacterium]